jgi:hypothetical protein
MTKLKVDVSYWYLSEYSQDWKAKEAYGRAVEQRVRKWVEAYLRENPIDLEGDTSLTIRVERAEREREEALKELEALKAKVAVDALKDKLGWRHD